MRTNDQAPSRARVTALLVALLLGACSALLAPARTAGAQVTSTPCMNTDPKCKISGTVVTPTSGGGASNGCLGGSICTQVVMMPDTLHIIVGPNNIITGQSATFSVSHTDPANACSKIYQVMAQAQMIGGITMNVGQQTVPSGGLCNFSTNDVHFTVQPFLPLELLGCPTQPLKKDVRVALLGKNMFGSLTSSDAGSGATTAYAVAIVTCQKNAQPSGTPVPMHHAMKADSVRVSVAASHTMVCPASTTVNGSFTTDEGGPASVTWTFGNGMHAAANLGTLTTSGPHAVSTTLPVTASLSSTVTLAVSTAAGTVTSAPQPFTITCLSAQGATTTATPVGASHATVPKSTTPVQRPINPHP